MPHGYCANCSRNVPLKKGDFDCCLFVILMFTGIGSIVYLIYWFLQPADRCAFCGKKTISPQQAILKTPAKNYGKYYSIKPSKNQHPESKELHDEKIELKQTLDARTKQSKGKLKDHKRKTSNKQKDFNNTKPMYCPYCGAKIRQNAKFCSNCQSPVQRE